MYWVLVFIAFFVLKCEGKCSTVPVEMVLVLDKSGSMSTSSFAEQLLLSQRLLRHINGAGSVAGAVVFNSSPQIISPVTTPLQLLTTLSSYPLDTAGGTAIGDAMQQGATLFSVDQNFSLPSNTGLQPLSGHTEGFVSGKKRVLVVMTDGEQTAGNASPEAAREEITARDIIIAAVGFGTISDLDKVASNPGLIIQTGAQYSRLFQLVSPITQAVDCEKKCSEITTCKICTNDLRCGWCASTNKCMLGTTTSPTNATCPLASWAYSGCGLDLAISPENITVTEFSSIDGFAVFQLRISFDFSREATGSPLSVSVQIRLAGSFQQTTEIQVQSEGQYTIFPVALPAVNHSEPLVEVYLDWKNEVLETSEHNNMAQKKLTHLKIVDVEPKYTGWFFPAPKSFLNDFEVTVQDDQRQLLQVNTLQQPQSPVCSQTPACTLQGVDMMNVDATPKLTFNAVSREPGSPTSSFEFPVRVARGMDWLSQLLAWLESKGLLPNHTRDNRGCWGLTLKWSFDATEFFPPAITLPPFLPIRGKVGLEELDFSFFGAVSSCSAFDFGVEGGLKLSLGHKFARIKVSGSTQLRKSATSEPPVVLDAINLHLSGQLGLMFAWDLGRSHSLLQGYSVGFEGALGVGGTVTLMRETSGSNRFIAGLPLQWNQAQVDIIDGVLQAQIRGGKVADFTASANLKVTWHFVGTSSHIDVTLTSSLRFKVNVLLFEVCLETEELEWALKDGVWQSGSPSFQVCVNSRRRQQTGSLLDPEKYARTINSQTNQATLLQDALPLGSPVVLIDHAWGTQQMLWTHWTAFPTGGISNGFHVRVMQQITSSRAPTRNPTNSPTPAPTYSDSFPPFGTGPCSAVLPVVGGYGAWPFQVNNTHRQNSIWWQAVENTTVVFDMCTANFQASGWVNGNNQGTSSCTGIIAKAVDSSSCFERPEYRTSRPWIEWQVTEGHMYLIRVNEWGGGTTGGNGTLRVYPEGYTPAPIPFPEEPTRSHILFDQQRTTKSLDSPNSGPSIQPTACVFADGSSLSVVLSIPVTVTNPEMSNSTFLTEHRLQAFVSDSGGTWTPIESTNLNMGAPNAFLSQPSLKCSSRFALLCFLRDEDANLTTSEDRSVWCSEFYSHNQTWQIPVLVGAYPGASLHERPSIALNASTTRSAAVAVTVFDLQEQATRVEYREWHEGSGWTSASIVTPFPSRNSTKGAQLATNGNGGSFFVAALHDSELRSGLSGENLIAQDVSAFCINHEQQHIVWANSENQFCGAMLEFISEGRSTCVSNGLGTSNSVVELVCYNIDRPGSARSPFLSVSAPIARNGNTTSTQGGLTVAAQQIVLSAKVEISLLNHTNPNKVKFAVADTGAVPASDCRYKGVLVDNSLKFGRLDSPYSEFQLRRLDFNHFETFQGSFSMTGHDKFTVICNNGTAQSNQLAMTFGDRALTSVRLNGHPDGVLVSTELTITGESLSESSIPMVFEVFGISQNERYLLRSITPFDDGAPVTTLSLLVPSLTSNISAVEAHLRGTIDYDSSNDFASTPVIHLPDLSVTILPAVQPYRWVVWINNIGLKSSNATELVAYANEQMVATTAVGAISSGLSNSFLFTWNPTEPINATLKFVVDPGENMTEVSRANNLAVDQFEVLAESSSPNVTVIPSFISSNQTRISLFVRNNGQTYVKPSVIRLRTHNEMFAIGSLFGLESGACQKIEVLLSNITYNSTTGSLKQNSMAMLPQQFTLEVRDGNDNSLVYSNDVSTGNIQTNATVPECCGDGVCQQFETCASCPSDCPVTGDCVPATVVTLIQTMSQTTAPTAPPSWTETPTTKLPTLQATPRPTFAPGTPSYVSSETPVVIPDNGCLTGFTQVKVLVDAPLIVDSLSVGLVISHTYRSDLRINLRSPQGNVSTLFDTFGNEQNLNVRFTDAATVATHAGNDDSSAPCCQRDVLPVEPLDDSFRGQQAQGNWTLLICDRAAVDIGSVLYVEISFPTSTPNTTIATLTPTSAATATPTTAPTGIPTLLPSQGPTTAPTKLPTSFPSTSPTVVPGSPTKAPTTKIPSTSPTQSPTTAATGSPTEAPTKSPTTEPTVAPTPTTSAAVVTCTAAEHCECNSASTCNCQGETVNCNCGNSQQCNCLLVSGICFGGNAQVVTAANPNITVICQNAVNCNDNSSPSSSSSSSSSASASVMRVFPPHAFMFLLVMNFVIIIVFV